jgi:hypothetical protein
MARSLLIAARGPFVEGQLGPDKKLIPDTAKYGNFKERQPLAHGAHERWLVMFERLSNDFGLDASALTMMAQCIP